MDKAVEFAREILRKEGVVSRTRNDTLKRDYSKSARTDEADLRFYCESMNLSYDDVMSRAREMAV